MSDGKSTATWRETLEAVAEALDHALGDTDITHIESDDELRERAPVQWACSQVNRLLQSAPSAVTRTGLEPWVLASLERIAVDYEKRAAKLADQGDYDCQFPEAEAQAVRMVLSHLVTPSSTAETGDAVTMPREHFERLADLHRGWCNYCKGMATVCGVGFKCSLKQCEIELRIHSATARGEK